MLSIGTSFCLSVIAEEQTIVEIAQISGDTNPIHLDDEYAKHSVFGRKIAHGLFCQNTISMILGKHLPEGTILLSQSFQYRKPVYIGDMIEVHVAVEKILPKENYVLSTVCRNKKVKLYSMESRW